MDDGKTFDIRFVTTATGDGAEKAAAGLEKVTTASNYLNASSTITAQEAIAASQAIQSLTAQVAALEAKKKAIQDDHTPGRVFAEGDAAHPDVQVAAINAQILQLDEEILRTQRQIAGTIVQQAAAQRSVVLSKEQIAKMDAEAAAASELEKANTLREATIEREIVNIKEAQKELQLALARGDDIAAEKLKGEIVARRMTLADLAQELKTRAAINEIDEAGNALITETTEAIDARVAARQLELDTMEAQEALNRELVAQEAERLELETTRTTVEERGVLGRRGVRGMVGGLGEEMGLGAMGFQLMGIAFLVETVWHLFEHHAEAIKKAREEQEKLNAEVAKEGDQIDKIKNLAQVESERSKIQEKIAGLREKQRDAEGDEYDSLTSQISAQESLLDKADGMTAAAIARQEEERQNQLALEAQAKALDDINEKYAETIKNAEAHLKTVEKIEEIQLGAELASINRQERDGQITHQEAARERVALQNAAEQKKYNDEQALAAQKIASLTKAETEDQKQAAQKQSDLDKSNEALVNAGGARRSAEKTVNSARDAVSVQKRVEEDAENTYHLMVAEGASDTQDLIAQKKRIKEAVEKLNLLTLAADQAQTQYATANDAYNKQKTDQANALQLRNDAFKTAQDTKNKNNPQIAEEFKAGQDAADIHTAKVQAEGPEDADKIDQGAKRDKEEQARGAKEKQQQHEHQESEEIRGLRSELQIAREQKNQSSLGNVATDLRQYLASHNDLTKDMINEIKQMKAELANAQEEIKKAHSNLNYNKP